MKSKEKGLLEKLLGWGKRRQSKAVVLLYDAAVTKARNPAFFTTFQVPDDVDGRFDALSLVVALVMRRLKASGDEGRALSQQLFDEMFSDMDLTLREMGAGDIGVSKRVRVMAEGFLGRLDAYATALDANDAAGLCAALQRNLLRDNDDADPEASGLVEYVLAIVADLDKVPESSLLAGAIAQ